MADAEVHVPPQGHGAVPAGARVGPPELPRHPAVDESTCIACYLCEKICPDKCIHLEGERGYTKGKGGKYATYFYIDHARCLFCGLCEEVCPVDSIYHSNEYEAAVYNRADAIHDLRILDSGHNIIHYER